MPRRPDFAAFDEGGRVRRMRRNMQNPTKALKQVGAILQAEAQASFKRQGLGKDKWPERKVPNVFGIIADFHAGKRAPPGRRFTSRPALRDTGALARSISWAVLGTKVVEVGSKLPYAGQHHRGTESESKPITAQVRRLLWAWLRGKGSQWKRELGWLLNRKFKDATLTMDLPERRIVGVTKDARSRIKQAIGVTIAEVR